MRILMITPSQPRTTGNWVSALRQKAALEQRGHTVGIVEAGASASDLEQAATAFAPDLVNLLHAYRSGEPWLACRQAEALPMAVTLTGTDVNHGLDDPGQRGTILRVLDRAQAVITINPLTHAALTAQHPEWAAKLHHVAPAVIFGRADWKLRERLNIPASALVFLHPAGIRPVKGNRELLRMFDRVGRPRRLLLVFCGPVLDEAYGRRFFADLERRPWALYAGAVPSDAMASVLESADVVLGNSLSEGYSNALQESACLGTPILAGNIPGNRVAFAAGRHGLLCHSTADFIRKARLLAQNPSLRRRYCRPAPPPSPSREAQQLEDIYRGILARPAGGPSGATPSRPRRLF